MKIFKLPSGVEFSEEELLVRAIASFLENAERRASGQGVLVDMHTTEAIELDGCVYAAVRDPEGTLKQAYRLRSDGQLMPLNRPPAKIADGG